jgi:sugar/nucleoside kinase (ribokinase family)
VNTQTNSANAGYNLITKYPRADFVCLDEPEIRLAAHDRYGDLRGIIANCARRLACRRVAMTRGHLGAVTYDRSRKFCDIPAFSDKVVDRIGAGDAFLAVTAPLAASGCPMDAAGFVGNAAGAIKVGTVCNRSAIEPVQLFKFIITLLK